MAQFPEGSTTRSRETEYVHMLIQEGIFEASFKALDLLDLAVAKAMVKERLRFVAGQAYPCLFDITPVRQATKEARDYMAREGNALVLASVILVNSPVLRLMANFYILVNQPLQPTQLFTDPERARQWLHQFKEKP